MPGEVDPLTGIPLDPSQEAPLFPSIDPKTIPDNKFLIPAFDGTGFIDIKNKVFVSPNGFRFPLSQGGFRAIRPEDRGTIKEFTDPRFGPPGRFEEELRKRGFDPSEFGFVNNIPNIDRLGKPQLNVNPFAPGPAGPTPSQKQGASPNVKLGSTGLPPLPSKSDAIKSARLGGAPLPRVTGSGTITGQRRGSRDEFLKQIQEAFTGIGSGGRFFA